eukprot:1349451-Rhodomonas_salina.1
MCAAEDGEAEEELRVLRRRWGGAGSERGGSGWVWGKERVRAGSAMLPPSDGSRRGLRFRHCRHQLSQSE